MKLKPILIGFSLGKDALTMVKAMNQQLDTSKINFDEQIPHVTLWMGFIKEQQVASLHLGLKKIFQNIEMTVDVKALEKFDSDFGSVFSLGIQMSRALYLLQNRVHHFFEPFRERADQYKDFDAPTLNYINNFKAKSLDNYDPHITIGFGEELSDECSITQLQLRDPKMFLMGNNCTCMNEMQ